MSASTALRSKNNTGEKVIASSSQPPSAPSSSTTQTWADTLRFWLDWGIKVLGVAAALVFGIWAPLSYQAANNASASDDAAQSSMISAAFAANSQASSALSIQRFAAAKQSVGLDAINSRIGAIGQLWLLDFCLRNTALAACKSFTSEIPITSLVSYLASSTGAVTLEGSTSTSAPASTTPSSSPTPSPVGSAPGTALSLPAILGIVFGVILFLGVIAGIFVSRLKRLRSRRYEEEQA